MTGHTAWKCNVGPLLVSVSLGLMLGACGSGHEDSHLAPSLGKGNAAEIQTEFEAAIGAQNAKHSSVAGVSASVHAVAKPVSQDEALLLAEGYHPLAREVVKQVNELRAQPQRCGEESYPPVGPLVWNAQVAYAALMESQWMVDKNQFSHEWEDGSFVWNRFDKVNYAWARADENIAAGFRTLEEAMQAWLDSPSHCKAMMRADIREIGLSVLPGKAGNRYRSYWTMALGTAR